MPTQADHRPVHSRAMGRTGSFLRFDDLKWSEFRIPDSSPPVHLARLHTVESGAFSTLVAFPPGWSRPKTGHYDVVEEMLILEGSFRMSGIDYDMGHYAWLPPGDDRTDSSSPSGALTLAWFGGPTRWSRGPGEPEKETGRVVRNWRAEPAVPSPLGAGRARLLREDDRRSTWMLDQVPASRSLSATVELFSLPDRVWTRVEPGVRLPDLSGPAYCRILPGPAAVTASRSGKAGRAARA
jgi:hypothetical protein